MFELSEPDSTKHSTWEVHYVCICTRLATLNFRHSAGVRQPVVMKTRQRWILFAFIILAGIVLVLICTGGITQSPAHASPIGFMLDLELLTDRDKCPACFGVKMCPQIITKQIKLTDWRQYKVSKFVNQKNIFYGQWDDGVVQKKVSQNKCFLKSKQKTTERFGNT